MTQANTAINRTDDASDIFKPIELTVTLRQAILLERERSSRVPRGEPTSRERILDAAEVLFGAEGPDVVSLRDISARSGAATGLIHYHFPTKENLLEETVARRATILTEIRRNSLAALGEHPSVAALLDAFMRPLVELAASADRGWASYCGVIARIAASESRGQLIAKHLDEAAKIYVAALKRAAPKADENDVLYAFGFSVILMVNVIVKNRRIETMSDGRLPAEDFTATYHRLLKYCVAGMEALSADKISEIK